MAGPHKFRLSLNIRSLYHALTDYGPHSVGPIFIISMVHGPQSEDKTFSGRLCIPGPYTVGEGKF